LTSVTVGLWRVAADTPPWTAQDVAGKGAANKGARWNHDVNLVGCMADSRALQ